MTRPKVKGFSQRCCQGAPENQVTDCSRVRAFIGHLASWVCNLVVYHTKQFSALTSIRGCGLSLFSCLLLEDSIIIRIVFFEDCFCKPCGLLKSQSYRAWVVDNKKERKGGIGTRLWGNWGSSIIFVLFLLCYLWRRESQEKPIG